MPRQSPPTSSTNDTTEQELVSREQYEFAGFAEPKTTAKSIFWATSQGDVQALLAGMSPAMWSQMQDRWKDRSEDEIKAGLLNDNDNKKVTGYRITNKLIVSENEVVLTIFQEGRNKEKKMRLVRVGDEWKFAGTPGM